MALELKDFELLGRMSGGDLIAIEAKYHLKCFHLFKEPAQNTLVHRKPKSQVMWWTMKKWTNQQASFGGLVEYIERCVYNGTNMFKLTDLSSLNVQRLEDIGIER